MLWALTSCSLSCMPTCMLPEELSLHSFWSQTSNCQDLFCILYWWRTVPSAAFNLMKTAKSQWFIDFSLLLRAFLPYKQRKLILFFSFRSFDDFLYDGSVPAEDDESGGCYHRVEWLFANLTVLKKFIYSPVPSNISEAVSVRIFLLFCHHLHDMEHTVGLSAETIVNYRHLKRMPASCFLD